MLRTIVARFASNLIFVLGIRRRLLGPCAFARYVARMIRRQISGDNCLAANFAVVVSAGFIVHGQIRLCVTQLLSCIARPRYADAEFPDLIEVKVKPLHQWSTTHLVLAVAAVVVAIILVLQLAERVFSPDEPVRADSSPEEPARPEPLEADVYIEDGDTVVVETANHQRVRVGSDGDAAVAEAMALCLREEIDRLSKEPFSDDDRSQETVVLFGLRIEGHGSDSRVNRAVQKCVLGQIEEMPELPDLPGSN